jgi:beta-glucosidase
MNDRDRPGLTRGPFLRGTLAAALAASLPRTIESEPLPAVSDRSPAIPVPTAEPALPGAAFRDPALPVAERVNDLVARLSLDEKVSQLTDASAAIDRLGIPAYHWWNEALHGVARAGIATVFPQAIGMAATWNETLIEQIGTVVGTEGRAKYNDAIARGKHDQYYGLTFWSPNINIFRDPRWGRGQETYGEDPVLTATLAGAYVRGLQGNDPTYLRVAACAKHFAVHSGPEADRHHFNVDVDPRDLHEFYLYAFGALVRDDGVAGVMSAYNSLDGKPCSINPALLHDILRDDWGFTGYVTSDCGAIDDLIDFYKVAADNAHAAALAIAAGVDISCLDTFGSLGASVRSGLVAETVLDAALRRLFALRMRLGMFDDPARVPYSELTLADNDSPAHAQLALQSARESIVLLTNDGTLPLRADIGCLAVIGPNADSVPALVGNYNGTPSHPVTVLAGIRAALAPRVRIVSAAGCGYVTRATPDDWDAALAAAAQADVVVFAGGISAQLEGEAGDAATAAGFSGGDRTRIELPDIQSELLRALHATGKPVVYVQLSGSAIATPWETEHLAAIVQAWYPGEAGGTAIADVLTGAYNPAGRLPVTFYAATAQLPPFADYALTGRTYRYLRERPLYAFGHGLSYTSFAYRDFHVTATAAGFDATVEIENTGRVAGDEVVQLYIRRPASAAQTPLRALGAFARVHLVPGQRHVVSLHAPVSTYAVWDIDRAAFRAAGGSYDVQIGASSADIRVRATVVAHSART